VGVTTNAAMLDRFSDDEVKFIVGCVDRIQISIYGLDEEEYTAMTKRPTFARAIAGAARILSLRRSGIFLAFRMLKQRSDQEVREWAHATFGPVEIKSIMRGGYGNSAVLDIHSELPFGASWAPLLTDERKQCMVPILAMQVSSNGDVGACGCLGSIGGLRLGNIADASLLEIFNGEANLKFWDWNRYGVPNACSTCTFYQPLHNLESDPGILDRWLELWGA
jgi:radical SAM protein with 4Fe4S-binding SPASM domain